MVKKFDQKIDVRGDIEEVMRSPKKDDDRDQIYPPSSSSLGKIAFTFIGFAILLLLGIIYFSYSYTTIIVTPAPQDENFETEIKAAFPTQSQEIKTDGPLEEIRGIIDTWSNNNPETLFAEKAEIIVEDKGDFAPTGEAGAENAKEEPGTAHGKIIVFNEQATPQELVAKTRFVPENSEVVFRIQSDVTIPANGQLEIEVFADNPGSTGDVGPSKFYLPGFSSEEKRKLVYAESSASMTGGVKIMKILSQSDIDSAEQELQQKLFNQALVELEAKIKNAPTCGNETEPKDNLPNDDQKTATDQPSTFCLVNTPASFLPKATIQSVLEKKTDKNVNDQAETFTLTMKLEVTAIIFDEAKLLNIIEKKVGDEVKQKKIVTLDSLNKETLDYSLKSYEKQQNNAIIAATITGRTVSFSENLINKSELINLSENEIKKYLKSHPEIKNIEFKEASSWFRKIPIFKNHVRIKIEKP